MLKFIDELKRLVGFSVGCSGDGRICPFLHWSRITELPMTYVVGLETIQKRRGLETEKPVLLTGPGKVSFKYYESFVLMLIWFHFNWWRILFVPCRKIYSCICRYNQCISSIWLHTSKLSKTQSLGWKLGITVIKLFFMAAAWWPQFTK